jgi:MoxR-like ATPase
VSFADIRSVAGPALRHRIGLSFEAEAEDVSPDGIVSKVLNEVPEVEGAVARELHA